MNKKNSILFAIIIGTAVLYCIKNGTEPIIRNDSQDYIAIAKDIADFQLDSLPRRAIGYPLFLALTGVRGDTFGLLVIGQLIVYCISVFFILDIASKSKINSAGQVLLLVILLSPLFIEASWYVLSEIVTVFCLSAGVWGLFYWLRNSKQNFWAIVSAFSFAYSGLVKPTYLLLPFIAAFVFIVLAFSRGKVLSCKMYITASIYGLAGILIIGAPILYNGFTFGNFRQTTLSSGFFIGHKTTRLLEYIPEKHAEIRDILIKHRDMLLTEPYSTHNGWFYRWSALEELRETTGMSEQAISDTLGKMNLTLIKKNPYEFLEITAQMFGRFWLPFYLLVQGDAFVQAWKIVFGIYHMIFLTAILFGAYHLIFSWHRLFARYGMCILFPSEIKRIRSDLIIRSVIGFLTLYTLAISILIEAGDPRYRWVLDPLLLLGSIMILFSSSIYKQRVKKTSAIPYHNY
jgi:4-amino-4-deoxy-L-arabinose transferase-like glycosyltransferase